MDPQSMELQWKLGFKTTPDHLHTPCSHPKKGAHLEVMPDATYATV